MAGFRYYKFSFTSTNGSQIQIAELELIGLISGADVTTPSTSVIVQAGTGSNAVANDGGTSYWQRTASNPHTFQINLPETIEISQYTITSVSGTYSPTAWTLYGSDDAVIWVAIDIRTGQSFATETKTYNTPYSLRKTFSGVVKDSTDTAAKRLLRLHRRDTGAVVNETWSSASTGEYSFDTYGDPMAHYVVCTDIGDETDYATVFSFPMTGSNNGTTFEEYNGYPVTLSGSPITSTTNPPSTLGLSSSGYFDGASYIAAGPTKAKMPVSGDFTLETWVRGAAQTGDSYRSIASLSHTNGIIELRYGNSGFGRKLSVSIIGTSVSSVYSCARTQSGDAGTWLNMAFVRYNGVAKLYVAGSAQSLNTGANPSTYPLSSWADTTEIAGPIGIVVGGGNYLGNIGPTRFVRKALYTADYTPPTSPPPTFVGNVENARIYDLIVGA